MTNAQIISVVESSVSSIFTKEDILKLLKAEPVTVSPAEADEDAKLYSKADLRRVFDGAISLVAEAIEDVNIDSDWVQLDTAEFSMSGNEVYLERVDLDEREICYQLRNAITELELDDNFNQLISIA